MDYVAPEDIIAGVLHFLPRDRRQFSAEREKLHKFFFDVRKKYFTILKNIRFRDRYIFPESQALDQALANFEASGLLLRKNDTPRYYYVENAMDDYFDRFAKPRLHRRRISEKKLKELSNELAERLCS